jgi:rSAM/selenodomain-associated transferase 1
LTFRIIVFAKAPRAGEVKTRLIPALGPEGAATLHRRLIEHALAIATAVRDGTVELCCAPDASDRFFASCVAAYGIALTEQGPGDLGERMYRAMTRALAAAPRGAILIGTDCPALVPAHLVGALTALDEGEDAVLAPAEDGGYVLIALRRADPTLFEDIAWGSAKVMHRTTERLDCLGWRWRRLETLWDVDRPEDLRRLRHEIAEGYALLPDL